jgi:hypothetical protein
VEKNNRTCGRAGTSFVNVGWHVAAARSGQDGMDIVGFAARQKKTESAKQNAG